MTAAAPQKQYAILWLITHTEVIVIAGGTYSWPFLLVLVATNETHVLTEVVTWTKQNSQETKTVRKIFKKGWSSPAKETQPPIVLLTVKRK